MIGGFRAQAAFLFLRGVILCTLLVFHTAWGQVRSFDFRTVIASREAAEIIRSEVDGGGAPEAFEKIYDKLLCEGRVKEIGREIEKDAPYDRRIHLYHRQPDPWESKLWSHWTIFTPPFFMKSERDVCFGHGLTPPRTGGVFKNFTQFTTGAGGFTTLRDNHWQLLSQWSYGDDMLLNLVKSTYPQALPLPPEFRLYCAEGYLMPLSESESKDLTAMAKDRLTEEIDQLIRNRGEQSDYFRFLLLPGRESRHQKGDGQKPNPTKPEGKVFDPDPHTSFTPATAYSSGVEVNVLATPSPDTRWTYVAGTGQFDSSSTTKPSVSSKFQWEKTIRIGSWNAIPANQAGDNAETAILLLRIRDLSTSEFRPKEHEPLKPLPESGIVSRVYHGIHPSALTELAKDSKAQPPASSARYRSIETLMRVGPLFPNPSIALRELLVENGVPDGTWTLVMSPQTSVYVGKAEVTVHQKIETILARFPWSKFTQQP